MTFLLTEDAALKAHLSGITIVDEKLGTRAVQVWFGTPDVELREQKFPFITIDLMDIRIASERQHSGVIYDRDNAGRAAGNNTQVYSYEYPATYDLVYQVSTWARHPRQDRQIVAQLMSQKFPNRYGKLGLVADVGNEVSYRHMFLDEYLKRDGVEDGRRLLRNIFIIRVVTDLPHYDGTATTKKVAAVQINPTTTNIPLDKVPI